MLASSKTGELKTGTGTLVGSGFTHCLANARGRSVGSCNSFPIAQLVNFVCLWLPLRACNLFDQLETSLTSVLSPLKLRLS